ncbi:MAG: Rha family transcriptional regulator [Azonexus sp.]
MANTTQSLVHQTGDRLFVTSLDISNRFGKRHDNVMQAITNLDCSAEFSRLNFKETVNSRENPSGGKPIQSRMYEITRDGFVFLCMGFTGPQAALWKERYIAAFNQMEQALRQPIVAAATSAPALPGLRMTRKKERIAMEMFVDGTPISEIAKVIGVSRSTASLVLCGKYQFSPGAGAVECSMALITAVAARHLANEQAALAAAQERAAQRYLTTANNQALANALDAVGRQLQQAPLLALGGAE